METTTQTAIPTKQNVPAMPLIPRNWHNDKLFLEDTIANEIRKAIFLQFDVIVTDGRAIRKDEFDKVVQHIATKVISQLGENYREVLSYYIKSETIDEYIIDEIYYAALVVMREKNKAVTIGSVTAFKTSELLQSMNLNS